MPNEERGWGCQTESGGGEGKAANAKGLWIERPLLLRPAASARGRGRGRTASGRQHDITSRRRCHPTWPPPSSTARPTFPIGSLLKAVYIRRARLGWEGVIMRLDTIIIMPPYAAAAILDNAMGVVHFGQAREGGEEEADDGSRRRQWAAMELTSFFAVNYYRRRERERARGVGTKAGQSVRCCERK